MIDLGTAAQVGFVFNLAMFAVMGLDKRRARRGGTRLRENLILAGSILGGAGGVLAAMVFFRHKTLKKKFRIAVPILFFINILAVCAYISAME